MVNISDTYRKEAEKMSRFVIILMLLLLVTSTVMSGWSRRHRNKKRNGYALAVIDHYLFTLIGQSSQKTGRNVSNNVRHDKECWLFSILLSALLFNQQIHQISNDLIH